jgi:hypothetical protein
MAYEEINDFIDKGSNKLKPEQGEIYKLKFVNAEVVTGKFGKQVSIEFVDLADGEKKRLYTSSQRLLKQLFKQLKIQQDELIYLRKSGDRFDTVYEVRRVEKGEKEKEKSKEQKKSNDDQVDIDEIDFSGGRKEKEKK